MNAEQVVLVEPTADLKTELLAMAEEYRQTGDDRYKDALEDFAAHMRNIDKYARGINLPAGHVRSTHYWLTRGRHIIGRSGLRHQLTPELEEEGGNIGYDIRPSERRKGYGTMILALTLKVAKESGFNRVLVTCDTDNIASARIIEKNGGEWAGESISRRSGKPVSRYWIEI